MSPLRIRCHARKGKKSNSARNNVSFIVNIYVNKFIVNKFIGNTCRQQQITMSANIGRYRLKSTVNKQRKCIYRQ